MQAVALPPARLASQSTAPLANTRRNVLPGGSLVAGKPSSPQADLPAPDGSADPAASAGGSLVAGKPSSPQADLPAPDGSADPAASAGGSLVAGRLARVARFQGFARLRSIVAQSRRHGLWILAWSLVGWIGTALAPVLSGEPFILMMLSPRALFVALASSSVPLVPFVILGTLRLSVTDASYYIIGHKLPNTRPPNRTVSTSRFGRAIRATGHVGDKLCRWFCARPKLAGAFLFFRPNGKFLGVAGAYGVSPWIAGISASAGTAVFLAAMHVGVGAIF